MQIQLNGQARQLEAGTTIAGLLEQAGYGARKVAVELNLQVVPRSQHDSRALVDGDRIEIIHAIGGG